jgi:hypothetical protein
MVLHECSQLLCTECSMWRNLFLARHRQANFMSAGTTSPEGRLALLVFCLLAEDIAHATESIPQNGCIPNKCSVAPVPNAMNFREPMHAKLQVAHLESVSRLMDEIADCMLDNCVG